MYVLYLDESGTQKEATHFVLAGLAVFEREIHWFGQDLDRLQAEYFPPSPPIHFHATKLRGRHVDAPWDQLSVEERRVLKNRVYDVIRNRRAVLFACAIEKEWAQPRAIVPLFASPTETRLLQFADFCSNAVFGRYHGGFTTDFDRIASKFDQSDGAVHGLVHFTTDAQCICIACFSRNARRS